MVLLVGVVNAVSGSMIWKLRPEYGCVVTFINVVHHTSVFIVFGVHVRVFIRWYWDKRVDLCSRKVWLAVFPKYHNTKSNIVQAEGSMPIRENVEDVQVFWLFRGSSTISVSFFVWCTHATWLFSCDPTPTVAKITSKSSFYFCTIGSSVHKRLALSPHQQRIRISMRLQCSRWSYENMILWSAVM